MKRDLCLLFLLKKSLKVSSNHLQVFFKIIIVEFWKIPASLSDLGILLSKFQVW